MKRVQSNLRTAFVISSTKSRLLLRAIAELRNVDKDTNSHLVMEPKLIYSLGRSKGCHRR